MDISVKALQLARKNAESNDCEIRFFHHDILKKEEQSLFPEYDIIISNPPYIKESEKSEMQKNVVDYEPSAALFVPDNDPLVFYKAISGFAANHLSPTGLLYLEINEQFGADIKTLLMTKDFDRIEVIRDINGKDRFIRAEVNNRVSPLVSRF